MTVVEVRPVSVSSSGLGKMEDRKRPATYDAEDLAPPSKRQVTATINGGSRSHQDTDIPGRDELEKFQKEAILRQMQEYKREKIDIEIRLNDLMKRSTYHDDHVRAVDAWFSQLLDEVRIALGKIEDITSFTPFQTQLLSSEDKEFASYLQARSQDISAALERIFSVGNNSASDVSELQNKIANLLATEKLHINQLEKLRLEKSQMEERLETASMRYMMAEKKLDRAKSMTVAKLERQAISGGRSEAGSGLGGGADGGKIEPANGHIDIDALAEAETARKAAVVVSTKQAEQIDQLASENEKLTSQLTTLKLKASSHSDDDYAHTDLFKQVRAQYEDAVKKINHLESTNSELRQEASKYQAEKSSFRTQLEAEFQATVRDKESQLSKAESDLARIRIARDEAFANLNIHKSTMDQERTSIAQIKDLLHARDERIKAYESELERLKGTEGRSDGDYRADDNTTLEDLEIKHANLERQYSMLNQELSSMSAAYKKISVTNSTKVANLSDLEEKVFKLSAEKAKAEQKYFAAMKSKETKDNEVRALRAQNNKSSDIVSQLKDVESSTKLLVVKLEKQLAESNEAISSLQAKARDAQSQLDQSRLSTDGLRKQVEELRSSIIAKDSFYAAMNAAQRKAETLVEEMRVDIEEKNKRLETWKTKGLGSENEHYEVLRSLVICTVCRKNFKDTLIKTCGHVFCKECVDDRVNARMRKCPNCNRSFGNQDVMKITL